MENSEYRPLAVVTGASSGIGYELARQFAENGYDLVIAADHENIFDTQLYLETYGGIVIPVQADLATFAGVENLYRAIKDLGQPISAVAINAGVGVGGEFCKTSLKDEVNLINLNITSVVHFTKKILPDLIAQNEGRILFTASVVSIMPEPFQAVYGASKAFVSSFAETLRDELKETKISITVFMPGMTNDDVAKQAFDALMRGEKRVIATSFKTKVQGWASKILPETIKAKMLHNDSRPGSALH